MTRYSHTGQCVHDLEAMRRFYVEALRFEEILDLDVSGPQSATLLRLPEPVELRAVYLRRDGFVLELLHFSAPAPNDATPRTVLDPGLTHLSFMVDDLDAACARVVEHGGTVTEESRLPGALFVADPEGNPVELLAPGSPLWSALHPD
jgi:catechol 2,3-dioxygenase-like lactoylglutathione lyase family enzyme